MVVSIPIFKKKNGQRYEFVRIVFYFIKNVLYVFVLISRDVKYVIF